MEFRKEAKAGEATKMESKKRRSETSTKEQLKAKLQRPREGKESKKPETTKDQLKAKLRKNSPETRDTNRVASTERRPNRTQEMSGERKSGLKKAEADLRHKERLSNDPLVKMKGTTVEKAKKLEETEIRLGGRKAFERRNRGKGFDQWTKDRLKDADQAKKNKN